MNTQPLPITVVIADDHPVVLRGVESLISAEADMTVLAAAKNGLIALEAIREVRPDVAVVDLSMPGLSGLEVLASARTEGLSTRFIVLTALALDNQIATAVASGAKGIMLKDAAPDELVRSIRAVAGGGEWFPTEFVPDALARNTVEEKTGVPAAITSLTPREREVIRLVAESLSNKEAAARLNISEGTIKIHLHNIYNKLGVANRTALATFAIAHRDRFTPR